MDDVEVTEADHLRAESDHLRAKVADLVAQVADLENELAAARTAQAPPSVAADSCPFEQWSNVETFATELLAPFLADRATTITAAPPWCDRWDLHPLAAHLIRVAYHSWPNPTGDDWPDAHRTWTTHLLPLVLAELPTAFKGCTAGHRSQNTTPTNERNCEL